MKGLNGMDKKDELVSLLKEIGIAVSNRCRLAFKKDMSLSSQVKVSPSDIIYRIDIEAEEEIVAMLEGRAAEFGGIVLLAEGIGENDCSVYPAGFGNTDNAFVSLVEGG